MALIDLAAEVARRWAKRLATAGISVGELSIMLGIRCVEADAVLNGNALLMPGAELRLQEALREVESRRRHRARSKDQSPINSMAEYKNFNTVGAGLGTSEKMLHCPMGHRPSSRGSDGQEKI